MEGMSRLTPIGVVLDIDPGECGGEDCTWSGLHEVTHDPYEESVEWNCPACGARGRRDVPSEDI